MYQSFKRSLLTKYPVCEACGVRPSTEAHHCLYHRIKGVEVLDCFENCSAVCHHCHMGGFVNSFEYQKKHYEKRRLEGIDMGKWNDQLPLRAKENWG